MADRYVVLCEPYAAPHLERYVADRAGGRAVRTATDKRSLRAALFEKPRETRLIAFCAKTIVPQSVLDLLALTPYNIHPGTPEFPGVHPDAFAHAHGKRRFGATAHEMIALIDAGAIVATADDKMAASASRMDYANIGFRRALDLFEFLVDFLRDVGFESVEHVESFGMFADDSDIKFLGHRISLNLVVTK